MASALREDDPECSSDESCYSYVSESEVLAKGALCTELRLKIEELEAKEAKARAAEIERQPVASPDMKAHDPKDMLRITFCSVYSDFCSEVEISRRFHRKKIAARLGAGIARVIEADVDAEFFEACSLLQGGDFVMTMDDILGCQEPCVKIKVSSVPRESDVATDGGLIAQVQRHLK